MNEWLFRKPECVAPAKRACAPLWEIVTTQIVEMEAHIDVVTCGAQPIEATFGDFFSDKDPGHCNHRYRRNSRFEKN